MPASRARAAAPLVVVAALLVVACGPAEPPRDGALADGRPADALAPPRADAPGEVLADAPADGEVGDAAQDAGTDAAIDAAIAGPDGPTGTDARVPDALPDAPPDALPDAPPDALPDAAGDVTPPRVVAVTPAAGSEVWLMQPIQFDLDEPVVCAGLTVSARVDGAALAATVEVTADGRALIVHLAADARGTGVLDVRIDGPITDAAGNPLAAAPAVALAVPAWAHPPIDRGPAGGAPAVVVTDEGDILVAWEVGAVGARRIVVSRHHAGAWSPLGGALGGGDAVAPALALEGAQPVVAWLEGGSAHAARFAGAWQPLAAPGAATELALAGAPGTVPVIALGGPTVRVLALVGDAWVARGELAPVDAIAGTLALARTPTRVVVGWVEHALAGAQLVVHRADGEGAALAPLVPLATGAVAASLALAAHGDAIAVAWERGDATGSVYAARALGTATTLTPLGYALDVDAAADARAPAIALTADGAPVVTWTETLARTGAIHGIAARWEAGGWQIVGGPTWLAGPAPRGAPRLVVHGGGAPVLAWTAAGALQVAAFDGPRAPGPGLPPRAPLDGCAFDAASPPARLSLTGCLPRVGPGQVTAHPGLVPYDLIARLWTDGTHKQRWLALPAGAGLTVAANGAWALPVGGFALKEFAIDLVPGEVSSRRAVETRVLVMTQAGVSGFSYRWRADGSDADLISDQAQTVTWMTSAGAYTHAYPSRSQCRSCHHGSVGPLLGPRPEQLARWLDYDGVIAAQLPTLAARGVAPAATGVPLPSPDDPAVPVERRVRAYLAGNCAHCHNPLNIWAKDLRFTTPLGSTRLCSSIVPGDPAASQVYQLVTSRPGMPALGSLAVDPLADALLATWIRALVTCP